MNNYRIWLVVIVVIAAVTGWVVLPSNDGIHNDSINIDIAIRQGLDLQGGSRVLLEAVVADDGDISSEELNTTRQIVERRVNGLGVTEAVVQTQGNSRIIVELPGVSDRELALSTIQGTGLLEFVNFGGLGASIPPDGTCILTDEQIRQFGTELTCSPLEPDGQPRRAEPSPNGQPFTTIMTGSGLDDAIAQPSQQSGQFGAWSVLFVLNDEGDDIFGDFTGTHIGQPLAIVLDGEVLSAPTVQSEIRDQGTITGNFTQEEAEALAVQLKFGALPVPFEVAAFDTVGPTLGKISVEKSIRAGIVGVITVLVFMVTYYRAPGLAAALALIIFAMINFAAYKTIPVTLTLPAITGFLISIGTAVDGNILIFERMKEELRAGQSLEEAMQLGFERAWTSIRDSNVSTIIICIILWFFGGSFGARIVQGFAITLGLGLVFNLFTAVIVTQTFLTVIVKVAGGTLSRRRWLLGV